MIVTKQALPRRTFLRGMGVTLGLPLLDAMVPALSAAPQSALRMGFFYTANGCTMQDFHSAGEGTNFELSPILKTIEPFKKYLVEINGLANKEAEDNGAGPHTKCHAVWLTGKKVRRTEGADIMSSTTVDQYAAQALGKETQLESLHMAMEPSYIVGNCDNGYSCVYMNTFSWKNPTTPVPMENSPRIVFERMFGDGSGTAFRLKEMNTDRSILDSVTDEIASLQRSLGARDRVNLGDYLESVRDVERRIGRAEKQVATAGEIDFERPMRIPTVEDEYYRIMFDLNYLAYRADVTRVTGLQISRETSTRTYPQIGVNLGHHDASHHQGLAERMALNTKINIYHMSFFARLLEKMHNTPDGDGTLLDHSMMLYGGGMGDGDTHNPRDLPAIIVGGACGKLVGGRLIKVARETPMMNLALSLLDKADIHLPGLGDSSGRIAEL